MASRQAYKRLSKEYKMMTENPPPYIVAAPKEDNILVWHYVITGPPETPYEDGQYHGTLVFPNDYPFNPPAIRMLTPNGRFRENTRLCLSMSDYHPDTWNPSWSVATILTGLLSFMTTDESSIGTMESTDSTKRKYAAKSKEHNATRSPIFCQIFPELAEQNRRDIEEAKKRKDETVVEDEHPFKQEQVVSLEEINDPEDRIRAQMLQQPAGNGTTSNSIGRSLLFVLFSLAALLVAVCYTRV
ncbi:AGR372Wp [Eremothecium gossypii ATCC 10895]|uniref:Ubiquitin-conjugating enzyme E2 6 n=1 Tax=Eremothecium gossypii (strain ATCC 10895 / CBS 109.51 / FGSC 9923 / NRRL Y-1056) TaxID=284811 RepID=UBC6_EREGS|nr:AGR372Wp [Eremothecium gossypii ATCC 10895]Q74Z34.1 RecName: Full=Ubiquitin-conjugating enzyme E2 6; AltName: Full=E2 ubiquitin-conjugating enzyme 6; AltName: Full=Ubiquitin carrier protein UBC6; AltName: Full=Ubiquitin-protein ligase UBC6 [Eremothecium gossypii ATCC 10895]AAS54862.1 AGR372Wp [Eremothecium gossypii ATCC 10895]AEY99194.1 FAGR372Wp [Eremothecium gossypii FDAG1]